MPKAVVKTQTLFQIYIDEASSAYEVMIADVENSIARMETLGMSREAIYDRLKSNLDNDEGVFSTFKGRLSKSVQSLIDTTSQVESNEAIKESAELFRWELEDLADHCDTCLANASLEPQTWDAWEELGIPGAGNTDCGQYCKCTLVGVE